MRHRPPKIINLAKELRKQGHSIAEIHNKIQEQFGQSPSYETVRLYVKDSTPQQHGRQIQRHKLTAEAEKAAKNIVGKTLSIRDMHILAAMLYWNAGSKDDFIITSSDHRMLHTIVLCLKKALKVPTLRFEFTIRLTQHHDQHESLIFWSTELGLPTTQFKGYYVQKAAKKGALERGLCRVRLKKGGRMLALTNAIVNEVVKLIGR